MEAITVAPADFTGDWELVIAATHSFTGPIAGWGATRTFARRSPPRILSALVAVAKADVLTGAVVIGVETAGEGSDASAGPILVSRRRERTDGRPKCLFAGPRFSQSEESAESGGYP